MGAACSASGAAARLSRPHSAPAGPDPPGPGRQRRSKSSPDLPLLGASVDPAPAGLERFAADASSVSDVRPEVDSPLVESQQKGPWSQTRTPSASTASGTQNSTNATSSEPPTPVKVAEAEQARPRPSA